MYREDAVPLKKYVDIALVLLSKCIDEITVLFTVHRSGDSAFYKVLR